MLASLTSCLRVPPPDIPQKGQQYAPAGTARPIQAARANRDRRTLVRRPVIGGFSLVFGRQRGAGQGSGPSLPLRTLGYYVPMHRARASHSPRKAGQKQELRYNTIKRRVSAACGFAGSAKPQAAAESVSVGVPRAINDLDELV